MVADLRRIARGGVVLISVSLPLVASAKGSPSRLAPASTLEGAKRCPEGMASLPGGTFKMGARGDIVRVAPFCIDVTEVTSDAYKRCVEAGKCTRPAMGRFCTYDATGKADHPVNCVDLNQAVAFCNWAEKRLPTEEEWEWAARGAEAGTTYPWGNGEPDHHLCWKRFEQGTCPVGSYPAGDSPQGVSDLAGNVAEWTVSVDKYFSSPGHVNCGGTWTNIGVPRLASASRGIFGPSSWVNDLGFRCAKTRRDAGPARTKR